MNQTPNLSVSGTGRPLRVLVLARLSRKVNADDMDRGAQTGMETQDTESLVWAQREGHTIVAVVADFKSGTSHPWNRPNARVWFTEPSKIAQYDAIVAYRLDRLSRGDDESTSMIQDWARANGKILLTTDGLHYPCEGADGIRWDVTKRIAHEEWLKISERYKRMTKFLRSGGFHVGRAPFGYRSAPVAGGHKTLVIDPVEAELIRDAATWYLGGMSLDDICVQLNTLGRLPRRMKSGRQPLWAVSTISKVLHNEVIAGRQKDLTGRTIMKVEPILSREIWEAVITRLAVRTKRTGISQSKSPALLTSIIVCTNCDRPMYRSGREPNLYYYCRVKGCGATIRIDVADADVHAAMSADDRHDVIEVIVPGSGHDAEIAEVKRDMSEALDAEDFGKLADLRAELDALRALPASPPRVDRRESDKTVAEMWAGMADDTERRAYLLARGARAYYSAESVVFVLGQTQDA